MRIIGKIISLEMRILIFAVLISLGWHLLWLSAVKVVVKPGRTAPVKFSKVAFLGPASGISPGEISMAPRSLSFLEKRYRNNLMKTSGRNKSSAEYGRLRVENEVKNDSITYLIKDTLEGPKREPAIISE